MTRPQSNTAMRNNGPRGRFNWPAMRLRVFYGCTQFCRRQRENRIVTPCLTKLD